MKTDAEVEELKTLIKTKMPDLYASIQLKAKSIGNEAFTYVRRGLQGEPNCFYGFEKGHVVGTPFTLEHEDALPVALYMVQFGATFCCIYGDRLKKKAEVAHGTH